jgi:hypothetical protein
MKKTGRNDPCPCGSGKKFKKCCERKMLGKRFMIKKLDSSPLANRVSSTQTKLSNFFQNKIKTVESNAPSTGKKLSNVSVNPPKKEQVPQAPIVEASQEEPVIEEKKEEIEKEEVLEETKVEETKEEEEEKKEPNAGEEEK